MQTRAFWDSGATICLCTHEWASRHGLLGVNASIYLKVVHRVSEELCSKRYSFDVVDIRGDRHPIMAFGVDSISTEAEFDPPEELRKDYPNLSRDQLYRRGGDIDVLLGMDVVGIHPVDISTKGHQRVVGT